MEAQAQASALHFWALTQVYSHISVYRTKTIHTLDKQEEEDRERGHPPKRVGILSRFFQSPRGCLLLHLLLAFRYRTFFFSKKSSWQIGAFGRFEPSVLCRCLFPGTESLLVGSSPWQIRAIGRLGVCGIKIVSFPILSCYILQSSLVFFSISYYCEQNKAHTSHLNLHEPKKSHPRNHSREITQSIT